MDTTKAIDHPKEGPEGMGKSNKTELNPKPGPEGWNRKTETGERNEPTQVHFQAEQHRVRPRGCHHPARLVVIRWYPLNGKPKKLKKWKENKHKVRERAKKLGAPNTIGPQNESRQLDTPAGLSPWKQKQKNEYPNE